MGLRSKESIAERMPGVLIFLTKGCFSSSRFIFGVPAVEGLSYSNGLSPLTLIESKFHKQSDKGLSFQGEKTGQSKILTSVPEWLFLFLSLFPVSLSFHFVFVSF